MFTPFDQDCYPVYESWFSDSETRRWLQPPSKRLLDYVTKTPGVFCWMIQDEDQMVGYVQMDRQPDGSAAISYAVNPQLRQRGYGKAILQALLQRSEARQFTVISAGTEVENVASQRCLASVGFSLPQAVPDAGGFLNFVYSNVER
ncbi:MAG: GNAT family N-acetyltransferase [Chloroflexota bacterium]